MPVVGRLDWISLQVHAGRLVHISSGSAKDKGKTKIKISIDDGTVNIASGALSFSLQSTVGHSV